MSSVQEHEINGSETANNEIPPEEAHQIVRALRGGEVDAVVVDDGSRHQLMALASLTDLDELNELIRALKSGEVDAFISNVDGTERVYSVTPVHEVLAQQYHLTKAITDNATTALFILDENQKCVFMNPSGEQLIGYTLDEMRARSETFHEVIHHASGDSKPCIPSECSINQTFSSRAQKKGEEIFVHKDGHSYNVAFSASPIRDATGVMAGTVIEVRDITKRKEIENALLDADRRKDEFIATLAHELRNPLAPISNLLMLMKTAEHDQEFVRTARDTIERQLAKIVRLVDDLLDISRITRNTIELRTEPVELASVIDDAVEMCRPMIEQFGHALAVDVPQEPIFLDADPARLSQVLGNLINNACKFTPFAGEISVTAERSDKYVVIKVKDNGIGIPPEQLKTIFSMFAQVRDSIGETVGGLGIGLALAKQLIELHKGSIEARSEGNLTGSEFIIRLPILESGWDMIPRSVDAERPAPSGRRILVVDDNFDSAESMSTLLSLAGNDCMMAHGGNQAVDVAEKFSPEIMLLDIGLPGMDGYEVCRTIRSKPWGEAIWIIAMTGWGQPEDRQRSSEAGFNAHLVKPVDFTKLYEVIERIPSRKRAF